jgi:hypothetical protein
MTNKQIAGVLVLLIAVVFGVYAIRNFGGSAGSDQNGDTNGSSTDEMASGTPNTTSPGSTAGGTAPASAPIPPGMEVNGTPTIANLSYDIEGTKLKLADGIFTGGARKTMLSDFGAWGDLNSNGTPDAAVVLIDQPGGSGSFYYVAAVLDGASGHMPTNSILLGDRVKIQSVAVANGVITVQLLDRKSGEPMSTVPSEAKTLSFHVAGGALVAGTK